MKIPMGFGSPGWLITNLKSSRKASVLCTASGWEMGIGIDRLYQTEPKKKGSEIEWSSTSFIFFFFDLFILSLYYVYVGGKFRPTHFLICTVRNEIKCYPTQPNPYMPRYLSLRLSQLTFAGSHRRLFIV